MSTPLTDSINALTQYANEITGKQDTTLSDAVGSLVEGYGQGGFNPFAYAYRCEEMFRDTTLPIEDFVLDFTGNTYIYILSSMFFRTQGVKHVTVKNLVSTATNFQLKAFIYSTSDLETLIFENCDFKTLTFESLGRNCAKLKRIEGELDCTNCTNAKYMFVTSPNLESFRFKQNTISTDMPDFGTDGARYTDESYISLANALNPSSPHTLTTKRSFKTDVANITGINDNGTFIADPNGTLTLADFITTVKGWTLS